MVAVVRWLVRGSALSALPVLVTGETGTGKELVARAVHKLDTGRTQKPFVAVNCAALSLGILESELFGHQRGAFTGASADRRGLVRAADGGVLFLDEIGELEPGTQTKLLRVLETGHVRGAGEDSETRVDVRIVAATNRDLKQLVRNGSFRPDLFHRLNVLPVHIPPLRERPADIAPLLNHFLSMYGHLQNRCGVTADAAFIRAVTEYDWPGNVRQLENVIRQSLIQVSDHAQLTLRNLPREIWLRLAGVDDVVANRSPVDALDHTAEDDLMTLFELNDWQLNRCLEECEKRLLQCALEQREHNQTKTARLLGITPRSVYNKIRKYRLHR